MCRVGEDRIAGRHEATVEPIGRFGPAVTADSTGVTISWEALKINLHYAYVV